MNIGNYVNFKKKFVNEMKLKEMTKKEPVLDPVVIRLFFSIRPRLLEFHVLFLHDPVLAALPPVGLLMYLVTFFISHILQGMFDHPDLPAARILLGRLARITLPL